MYIFVVLELLKESDLLLGPLPPPDFDNQETIKLNHNVLKITQSDQLQEPIHKVA